MKILDFRNTLSSLCVLATLSSSAWAGDSVTVPGYAPVTGVERSYRVQKATESDMSLWFDASGAASVITRGEFRQRMTVVSRDDKGMRVRWSLSADLPDGIAGAVDTYQMNPLYRNSLTAYGVGALEMETDLNGFPNSLFGVDQILANMRRMATNGPDGALAPPQSGVYDIIDRIQENPLQIVTVLTPEAQLLATGQAYQDEAMEVGKALTASRNEDYGGVSVPVASNWLLQSTDVPKHTATLSVVDEYDPDAFRQSQQGAIDKFLGAFGERLKSLTADQLTSVKRASKTRRAEFVVSLSDGSVIEALETVTVISAGSTFHTYTHIRREDAPAVLQVPAILTAADLRVPKLKIEPLSPAGAAPGIPGLPSISQASTTISQEPSTVTSNDAEKSIAPVWLEVKSAQVLKASNGYGYELEVVLTPDSGEAFQKFTQAAIGRQTQVLIDDKVVIEPWIREPIMGSRLTLTGSDMTALRAMAEKLSISGAKILVRTRS
ncbi:SecDF P1 head subdomain-containing protein [Rhizobium sp. BR 314]|uniref:SecDF P1 head subdomain-containing protein n=1 Tax=Rhizobium sp. BR 314 TaxID=3040013 RepID=UPI0039BEEE9E